VKVALPQQRRARAGQAISLVGRGLVTHQHHPLRRRAAPLATPARRLRLALGISPVQLGGCGGVDGRGRRGGWSGHEHRPGSGVAFLTECAVTAAGWLHTFEYGATALLYLRR
jgi:hypothetical protein